MSTYDDVMEIEDGEAEAMEHYKALQRQINSGLVWQMQGSMGRTAMAAIEEGFVMTGRQHRKDYWGNTVPSRDVLEAGTKGTYDFVAERLGVEWADEMEAVE
jgi:hypothetical protein